MSMLRLRLYITGRTVRSETALENLHAILAEHLEDHFELTIVDVLDSPQLAEDERILATPTLVKMSPSPVRKIVGDLSDAQLVLSVLEI